MQWLVTGCSTGLGLEIARAALQAGQKCIATSRNPASSPDAIADIEKLGGVWATLDVSSPSLENDIGNIVKKHGPVDVVVNNAGYADGAPLEMMDLDKARQMFETNFWGPIRIIQALVPSMRSRHSGVIINISSAVNWNPPPGAAVYAGSKFAIEGISEALATELSTFNIRVLIAEPGAMRTKFFDQKKMKMPILADAYKGTPTEFVMQAIAGLDEGAPQDARRTAEAIVKEVLEPSSTPMALRMPLGMESLGGMRKRAEEYIKIADSMEKVAVACDF
ncbi:putative oxidoreductase [Fonsecaea pedrosoi]|nr:putative oxidoreductase [Fonsecaea pedrosoi]